MISEEKEKAIVKEIFSSVQGEGPFIGAKQIFIRFCMCNLNCSYCDTDYSPENVYYKFYPNDLADYLNKNYDLSLIHSISLTGGEPLIWAEFLKKFMPLLRVKYYLETNAVISEGIEKIIQYTDIIAADIKLPGCSGHDLFKIHDKFFETVRNLGADLTAKKTFNRANKNIFAKIVFDENITDEEIQKSTGLAKKYDFELIIQPKMIDNKLSVSSKSMINIFEKFVKLYKYTRLIPQVHKFINIE